MKFKGNWRRLLGALVIAPLLWMVPTVVQASDRLAVETDSYSWGEETLTATLVQPSADTPASTAAETDRPDISRYATASSALEPAQLSEAIASYGPFHVISPSRVEIFGDITSAAPALFARILRDYPGIRQIDFIDCPGTTDDAANLQVARMIRRAGIATHVPAGGFAGSGGVELFLAGAVRSAHPTAEFAVHSWIDEDGMQADDFAMSDPVHQAYLTYYREMGMSQQKALSFYKLTNSVPYETAIYLKPADIAGFIGIN